MPTHRKRAQKGVVGHATTRLAKLARPQSKGTLPRQRLFNLLDATLAPVSWVHGPGGAGKTTLIASYAAREKVRSIWYQIDSGDDDPASFFYFLGLAVEKHGQKTRPMPLLAPECLADLEGFTRRFVREMHYRLGATSIVVFDNYQELSSSSIVHQIIAWSVAEIPSGHRFIVLSREAPPPAYVVHLVNSLIVPFGWDVIRFNSKETFEMMTQRWPEQPLTEDAALRLHETSGGWAAGVVLMLERYKRYGTIDEFELTDTMDSVFDYFAGQVFEQLHTRTQQALLRSAYLPQVTQKLAEALDSDTNIIESLNYLVKRQLFVGRCVGKTTTYQFHPLFSLFLQARSKSSQSYQAWQAQVVTTAEALVASGLHEDAMPLFLLAKAWTTASSIVVHQAQHLLDQGRWQTLESWIRALPETVAETDPWLRYWLGMCRLMVEPGRARADLEPAYTLFKQGEILDGQILAATAIIEAHMIEWLDYRQLDRWISILESLLSRSTTALPSVNAEVAALSSLFIAVISRHPYREDIPALASRLTDMLQHDLKPNCQLIAARGLFIYGGFSGSQLLIEHVMACTQKAFNAPAATALNRVWYAARLGHALRYCQGKQQEARKWFTRARAIAHEHGVKSVEAPIAIFWAWSEDIVGDSADIARELAVADEHFNPQSPVEAAFRHTGLALLRAQQDDHDAAVKYFRASLTFFEESGYTLGQLGGWMALTGVYLLRGEFYDAEQALGKALRSWFRGHLRNYAENLLGAGIALGMHDETEAAKKLREAFAIGSKHRMTATLSEHFFRPTIARLCAFALIHGIDPTYAKRVICDQQLLPPSSELEQWPWRVRVYVLNGFQILLDERQLRFPGQGPKKPLELLKLIVTSPNHPIDTAWLAEQLWPEAENPRELFNVTLGRLRQLLALKDVLILEEGKLRLNSRLAWTDVTALERVVGQCRTSSMMGLTSEQILVLIDSLFSHYQGEVLQGEPAVPWLVAARDRLRRKCYRAIRAIGCCLESKAEWEHAEQLYEQALEIDNLSEEIYRHLIDCLRKAGRPADALRAYERCSQGLLAILSTAPSIETQTLLKAILQDLN